MQYSYQAIGSCASLQERAPGEERGEEQKRMMNLMAITASRIWRQANGTQQRFVRVGVAAKPRIAARGLWEGCRCRTTKIYEQEVEQNFCLGRFGRWQSTHTSSTRTRRESYRCLDGEEFETVASSMSKCPSRSRGGNIGWIKPGQTDKDFESVAFGAVVDGGVETCRSSFGYHLIMVTNEKVLPPVKMMSTRELSQLLSSSTEQNEVQLVDVREPYEIDLARLPGFKVLSLSKYQEWAPRISSILDPSKKTIVLCHHGVRSENFATFLTEKGFIDVHNVVGGINAYSREDPSIPIY